jgi:DNA polymerase
VKTATSAAEFLPPKKTLPNLRTAAKGCRGCPLHQFATQTVFGAGPVNAELVLVGEQPGDKEDLEGEPFVGPAGKVLERALEAAGIERSRVYVTNAVKHFSFQQRGKARLHQRPRPGEVRACRPWLDSELDVIRPKVVVLLGATAAQALLGPAFRVSRDRGKALPNQLGATLIATQHPSAILRKPSSADREQAFAELVSDLSLAQRLLREAAASPRAR